MLSMIRVSIYFFFKNDGESEKGSKRGLGDEMLRKGKVLGKAT